jgi:hypothetical protein
MSYRNPAFPLAPPSGRWGRVRSNAGTLAAGAVSVIRGHTAPVVSHLRDQAYSIIGLGCISAAAFVHSVFTGLLVTGLLVLVFEWKVSE